MGTNRGGNGISFEWGPGEGWTLTWSDSYPSPFISQPYVALSITRNRPKLLTFKVHFSTIVYCRTFFFILCSHLYKRVTCLGASTRLSGRCDVACKHQIGNFCIKTLILVFYLLISFIYVNVWSKQYWFGLEIIFIISRSDDGSYCLHHSTPRTWSLDTTG